MTFERTRLRVKCHFCQRPIFQVSFIYPDTEITYKSFLRCAGGMPCAVAQSGDGRGGHPEGEGGRGEAGKTPSVLSLCLRGPVTNGSVPVCQLGTETNPHLLERALFHKPTL